MLQDPIHQDGVVMYGQRSVDSIEEAVGIAVTCANESPEKLCTSVPNGLPSATAQAG